MVCRFTTPLVPSDACQRLGTTEIQYMAAPLRPEERHWKPACFPETLERKGKSNTQERYAYSSQLQAAGFPKQGLLCSPSQCLGGAGSCRLASEVGLATGCPTAKGLFPFSQLSPAVPMCQEKCVILTSTVLAS